MTRISQEKPFKITEYVYTCTCTYLAGTSWRLCVVQNYRVLRSRSRLRMKNVHNLWLLNNFHMIELTWEVCPAGGDDVSSTRLRVQRSRSLLKKFHSLCRLNNFCMHGWILVLRDRYVYQVQMMSCLKHFQTPGQGHGLKVSIFCARSITLIGIVGFWHFWQLHSPGDFCSVTQSCMVRK